MDSVGSIQECRETATTVFQKYEGLQKYSKILVDEVHIKPGVRYQGNHLIGYSADCPEKPARTMLALRVCPLMGEAFIARIIPVYSLSAELLFDQIQKLIVILHEVGAYVFLVMADNLRANVSCFKMFHDKFGSINESSINHPVSNDLFKVLYLLFDPIHLFKNIKNNWLTENLQKLKFYFPGSEETVIACWGDIIRLYKDEQKSLMKESKLDYATVYPTNFVKQKVNLTINVFCEKTGVALRNHGFDQTANFVLTVTRLINIMNVGSPNAGSRSNDLDRGVINCIDDDRLNFMLDMAESFEKMNTSCTEYKHRVMCLTSDTSNGLSITIRGMVSLAKELLMHHNLKYVMFRMYQSDRLEGEFGAFRQLNGGNYYMSADHVHNALKLQRIKLFAKIDTLDIVWHTERSCCSQPLTEDELDALNESFDTTNKLNEIDRSTVYYVAGYISHKENLNESMDDNCIPADCPDSEFTTQLSRGKLSHPPCNLYDLGLYLLVYYKSVHDKMCLKRILVAFNEIYAASHLEIPNITSVLKRFANTFTKAFATGETEKIVQEKKAKLIKRKRLER